MFLMISLKWHQQPINYTRTACVVVFYSSLLLNYIGRFEVTMHDILSSSIEQKKTDGIYQLCIVEIRIIF